jgi:hypothetical protein
MPQDQPGPDQPTQQLPSQDRTSSDQPTQQLPSQERISSDQPAQQRSSGFLGDQQTRRLFLKAAVISGAAVAAVGAAGAAAANASPQILRQIRGEAATTSGGCIGLKEASKDNKDGPNNFLELSTDDWDTLSAGGMTPCILVTDKNNSSHTLLTTVTCNAPKGGHILLGICPPIPKGAANTFPAGSCVTLATGCPPEVDCGPSPCS